MKNRRYNSQFQSAPRRSSNPVTGILGIAFVAICCALAAPDLSTSPPPHTEARAMFSRSPAEGIGSVGPGVEWGTAAPLSYAGEIGALSRYQFIRDNQKGEFQGLSVRTFPISDTTFLELHFQQEREQSRVLRITGEEVLALIEYSDGRRSILSRAPLTTDVVAKTREGRSFLLDATIELPDTGIVVSSEAFGNEGQPLRLFENQSLDVAVIGLVTNGRPGAGRVTGLYAELPTVTQTEEGPPADQAATGESVFSGTAEAGSVEE